MWAGAAGRGLSAVISKFVIKNVGYNTFSTLYESHVVLVMDYSVGVWGYYKFKEGIKVLNWAIRWEYIRRH